MAVYMGIGAQSGGHHTGWFRLSSFSLGESQPILTSGTHEIVITKESDRASAILYLLYVTREKIAAYIISGNPGKETPFHTISLTNGTVCQQHTYTGSVQPSSGGGQSSSSGNSGKETNTHTVTLTGGTICSYQQYHRPSHKKAGREKVTIEFPEYQFNGIANIPVPLNLFRI